MPVMIVVAILGLLLFFISTNPKVSRVGEILFFCSVLAICLGRYGSSVRLPW